MAATAFLWLIATPLLASPLVYLAGRLQFVTLNMGLVSGQREIRNIESGGQAQLAWRAAIFTLSIAWIPFVLAVRHFNLHGVTSFTIGAISLRLDGLSVLLAALSLALGLLVALYSGPYLETEAGQGKFYALLVATIGAMIGLACAGDLFNLWLWFELMAVSTYLLVAFYQEQPASLEAGFKYLVQSAVGSALILLGIALVLAQTGTLDLDEIRSTIQSSALLLPAGALFIIGFGVKIALVPLHTWLPDAHSQAPSGISALLSGVVIEAGLIALLRSLAALSGMTISWGALLLGFGALNMLAGNLLALRQRQVKRLLAYSSLSHVGYMLLGVGIGLYAGQIAGAQGGFFHLLTHGLMKGLAFLAAGVLLYALHIKRGEHHPLTITDLSGAARRYPLVALTLSLALLGLGGLPPLAGFMSKWQILAAGFATGDGVICVLVIFAALNSALSLVYYMPLVNALYRQQPSPAVQQGLTLPITMRLPLVLLALAVVAIGIWPHFLNWLTEPAAQALFTALGH